MSSDIFIRMLEATDTAILDRVAPGVFDHEIDPQWTAEFLSDPRHHMAVALRENEVVGMASAVHYVHPDKAPELWVNEVGVAPALRSKGIGRRLLHALFERGRSLGCREAWLGSAPGNAAAHRLFSGVGGKERAMIQFTFDLDEGR